MRRQPVGHPAPVFQPRHALHIADDPAHIDDQKGQPLGPLQLLPQAHKHLFRVHRRVVHPHLDKADPPRRGHVGQKPQVIANQPGFRWRRQLRKRAGYKPCYREIGDQGGVDTFIRFWFAGHGWAFLWENYSWMCQFLQRNSKCP